MSSVARFGFISEENHPSHAFFLGPILQTVTKIWGVETWLANTDKYCAKILSLNPGYQCSQHLHKVKDETFFVMNGVVTLEFDDYKQGGILLYGRMNTTRTMHPGDSQRIEPQSFHRFSSEGGATILEISTHHDDADVVRFEESKRIESRDNLEGPRQTEAGIWIPKGRD